MTDTQTRPYTTPGRDGIAEAALAALAEMRDLLHHTSGEPGSWAYEGDADPELTAGADELAGRLERAAKALRQSVREAKAGTAVCAKCATPFEDDGKFLDSARRSAETPFCRACVDHCHDSEIADHVCVVDRWNWGEMEINGMTRRTDI
ncbi:hypothetical protein ACGFXC_10335 [Streptomyces sp. NPDC048507]|uniref:hypothetical protein n=1 Tax=Streptomyces sp. NPDC048507 TaxID=3365560 RepID=UPI003716FBCE